MITNFNARTITNKQIAKLSLVKAGDSGYFSKVYKFNEKECIKVFNEPKKQSEIIRYNDLTRYSFNNAIFPKKLLFKDYKLVGYIMDYVDGILLDNIFEMEYSKFLKMYKNFMESVLYEVCEKGFVMQDVHPHNVIYDQNNEVFKSIDCDEWIKSKNPFEESFFELVECFICSLNLGAKYLIDENTDFIDYYETLREIKEKQHNTKIETIRDMKELRYK